MHSQRGWTICLPANLWPHFGVQIRQEVEVQLANQLRQAEAERQRAMREAAKLGKQVQQQAAQVQQVAQRKAQVAAHK